MLFLFRYGLGNPRRERMYSGHAGLLSRHRSIIASLGGFYIVQVACFLTPARHHLNLRTQERTHAAVHISFMVRATIVDRPTRFENGGDTGVDDGPFCSGCQRLWGCCL